MKKLLISLGVLAALVSASTLNAEWALQDDLENGLDAWDFSNRLSLGNQDTEPLDGTWVVVDRPFDDQGGKALAASEGLRSYNVLNIGLRLGDLPNTEGAIYTVYLEVAESDLSGSRGMGLMTGTPDLWFTEDPLNPGAYTETLSWGDYSPVFGIGKNGMNTRNVDGTGYAPSYSSAQAIETWYSFWIVVDPWNYLWDLYVQGGEFTEQTKVTNVVETGYTWRNITQDHLRTLWIRLSGNDATSSTSGAPTYFDNVYLDVDGANLSAPPIGGASGPQLLFADDFATQASLDNWVINIAADSTVEINEGIDANMDGYMKVYDADPAGTPTATYDFGPTEKGYVEVKMSGTKFAGSGVLILNSAAGPIASLSLNVGNDSITGILNAAFDMDPDGRENGVFTDPLNLSVETPTFPNGRDVRLSWDNGKVTWEYTMSDGSVYTRMDKAFGPLGGTPTSISLAAGYDTVGSGKTGYFDSVAIYSEPSDGGGLGDWASWPIVDEAGNVDTLSWMQYLNVANDPWIYSYSLSNWVYIDQNNFTESGNWVYVLK